MRLPEDRYSTIAGHRLRYWECGSGPPLLLLHGLGESALVWHRCIQGLAQTARAIALDLPGHGYSDMPLVEFDLPKAAGFTAQLMAALDAGPFFVAGNSMGGAIALDLALTYPDKVAGLILVDSASLGRGIAWWLRLISLPGIGELLERPSPGRMRQVLKAILYDASTVGDEFVMEMSRERSRPGATSWLLRFLRRGVNLFGQRPAARRHHRLGSLAPPLLVLWGRQDRIVPLSQGIQAAASAPNAQLHVFEQCGHWPEMEHPEEFTQVVSRFVADVTASRTPAGAPAPSPETQKEGS